MMKTSVVVMLALSMAACGGAPKTATERETLEQRAQVTLSEMQQKDPSLRHVLMEAHAYVVFPEIGKGGAIVGGARGRGVLYERGRPTGSVSLTQASVGLQLGGQTFAELIVLRDPAEAQKIRSGQYDLGADISAVALKAGAAASMTANQRTAVFVMPRGGLMAEVSVSGQRLSYTPFNVGGNGQG